MAKAMKYKVRVFRGYLEWTHGAGMGVDELFIPSKGVAANVADDELHVFRCEKPRGEAGLEEITIDDALADELGRFVEACGRCKKGVEDLLRGEGE